MLCESFLVRINNDIFTWPSIQEVLINENAALYRKSHLTLLLPPQLVEVLQSDTRGPVERHRSIIGCSHNSVRDISDNANPRPSSVPLLSNGFIELAAPEMWDTIINGISKIKTGKLFFFFFFLFQFTKMGMAYLLVCEGVG